MTELMITKQQFIERLKRGGADVEMLEAELDNFDELAEATIKVEAAMPGIGFASIRRRMNCFIAVCRHLDQMMAFGELDMKGAQLVLNILRIQNKAFEKAIVMFDLRGTRYTARERAELPETASEYLAGLEMYR